MTSKEKAKELIDKLQEKIFGYSDGLSNKVLSYQKAKQCALIAVNEILNLDIYKSDQCYWLQVKKEIEEI